MRNTKKLQIYLGLVGLFLIVVGVSYSLFTANYIGYVKQKIAVGEDMIFSYVETDNTLKLTEKDILSIENGKTSTNYFDFSVSLKSDSLKNVDYYIYLTKDETSTLDEQYIYTYLTDQNNNVLNDATKINELIEPESYNNSYGIYGTNITSNNKEKVEHNYRLRVWIDENYEVSYTTKDEGDDHTLTKVPKTYKFTVNVATGTLEPPQSEGNLSETWKDKTTNESNYLALYTLGRSKLPNTYKYNNETYTLDTTIDVSEQSNGNVILGEYTSGENMIAIIGQDGNVVAPVSSQGLFFKLSSLAEINLSKLDTSNTTDTNNFFNSCSSLTSIDLSNFDTSNVIDMNSMFYNCTSLITLDLTNLNTQKSTSMFNMFQNCTSLQAVIVGCNWKTASNTSGWFTNALTNEITNVCQTLDGTLSRSWKGFTANEESYLALYTIESNFLPNTYTYNDETYILNETIDVSEKLNKTVFLGEYISGDKMIAVIRYEGKILSPENSSNLFSKLTSLEEINLTNLDTSETTIMGNMFSFCSNLITISLLNLDTSKVTDMDCMFWGCTKLKEVLVDCDFKIPSYTTNMFKYAGTSAVTKVCND